MKMIKKEFAKRLYEELYITEYESTLDEGWTIDNESWEARHYLELSDEGKKIYAMTHARIWADDVMKWEEEVFYNFYGNQFDE